jgi:hypothetical protein
VTPDRDLVIEVIYRALVRYDRERRSLRNMRLATGQRGPTIKRGTVRPALAVYLADVVLRELKEQETRPD